MVLLLPSVASQRPCAIIGGSGASFCFCLDQQGSSNTQAIRI